MYTLAEDDQRSGTETLAIDWSTCEDGAAMFRHAAEQPGVTRQRLVLAACACARLALVHVPAGELRPLRAIEAAEAWARDDCDHAEIRAAAGELRPLRAIEAAEAWARDNCDRAEIRAAAADADAAAADAADVANTAANADTVAAAAAYAVAAAAAAAAYAAYYVSDAADAAAGAASATVAYVADAVANAADADYADATWRRARADAFRLCADEVRRVIPCPYHDDCLSLDALAVACGGRIAAR